MKWHCTALWHLASSMQDQNGLFGVLEAIVLNADPHDLTFHCLCTVTRHREFTLYNSSLSPPMGHERKQPFRLIYLIFYGTPLRAVERLKVNLTMSMTLLWSRRAHSNLVPVTFLSTNGWQLTSLWPLNACILHRDGIVDMFWFLTCFHLNGSVVVGGSSFSPVWLNNNLCEHILLWRSHLTSALDCSNSLWAGSCHVR